MYVCIYIYICVCVCVCVYVNMRIDMHIILFYYGSKSHIIFSFFD